MNKRARYSMGRPCWFEFATDDVKTAKRFYHALFGWTFEESGGRHRALVNRKPVAAIVESHDQQRSGWIVYLATDDLDATAAAVVAAGGTMIASPEKTNSGKRAVAVDPAGGAFGLWQGGSFRGSALFDAPGAVCWAELTSRAPPEAAAFFRAVFGFEVKQPFPGYHQLSVGGKAAAGILGIMHERRPTDGIRAWMVYFQVKTADDTAAAAVAAGGKILEPAEDSPFGRLAVVADPFGARITVIGRDGAKP
jgi:predicted enzyme related to lactoylglutathione lyase